MIATRHFPTMRLARCILDSLLPCSCVFCGYAAGEQGICEACRDELPWVVAACPTCAMPRPPGTDAMIPCGACQRAASPIAQTVAPLHYRFPVDALIKSLKFRGHGWIAPALANLVWPALTERQIDADAIVPVPLHRWRHARRGFNQAAELARPLGRRLGLPVLHLLRRRRATHPQSGLDAAARRRNLRNAFIAVRRALPGSVILVDDVVTTGETAYAAARALTAGGVRVVSLVAIARSS